MNQTITRPGTGQTLNVCQDCAAEMDLGFRKVSDSLRPCQVCIGKLFTQHASFDGIGAIIEIYNRAIETDNPVHYIASSFPFRTDDITRVVVLKIIEICMKARAR